LLEALAGLGSPVASPKDSARYISEIPQNPYDECMRTGNLAGQLTQHYVSTVQRHLTRITHLQPGQTMKDLPEHLWHESYRRRACRRVKDGTPSERRGGAPAGLKRLRGNLNCLTITGAATSEFVHPHEDRTLTPRECARVQSFFDAFQFHGSPQ